MNAKLLNTQIEALTPEHGADIVKFYMENGFDSSDYTGNCCADNGDIHRYYGVNEKGLFYTYPIYSARTTITLEQAKALVQEPEYPETFDLEMAKHAMDRGYKVRCKDWHKYYYIYKKDGDIYTNTNEIMAFSIDSYSTDIKWELYKEPELKEQNKEEPTPKTKIIGINSCTVDKVPMIDTITIVYSKHDIGESRIELSASRIFEPEINIKTDGFIVTFEELKDIFDDFYKRMIDG